MTNQTLPPLTEREFAEQAAWVTYLGVPFFEDEEAYGLYAWGQQDPQHFADAVNAYDLEMNGGDPLEPYTGEDVLYKWAVTVQSDEYGVGFQLVPEGTPDSWPVSVIWR